MNFSNPKMNRGFTLMEMLVYIALLSALSIFVVQGMLIVTKAFTDFRISRDLNASGVGIIERLSRDIRGAYDIDAAQSTFDASPGRLMLNTKDISGVNTTVEFYVEGGVLKVKEGGIARGALMASTTQLSQFVVRQIVGVNTKAVKIEATITASRGGLERSRNFYTTAVLRGTY